jgi:hypothetical protein
MDQALFITLIGMSLVFATILLLWAVMALLVHLTAGKAGAGEIETDASELELKQRAAAAAVGYALAHEHETDLEPHEFPLPPTAIVSAWQAVMRSNIANKRGRVR